MQSGLGDKSWNDLLPETFKWLSQVKITGSQTVKEGTHHFVLLENTKGALGNMLAPSLSDALKSEITSKAFALGWSGTSSVDIQTGSGAFTLIPLSKYKVSNVRLGRQAGLEIAYRLQDKKISKIALVAGGEKISSLDCLEGLFQGLYQTNYKGDRKPASEISDIVLIGENFNDEEIRKRLAFAKASYIARTIQDAPPNVMNPLMMAEAARKICDEFGYKFKIFGREEILRQGMGSFHSVGKGSHEETQFICIEVPGQNTSETIALLGKGVTFDSGGISLKPSSSMDNMKYDLSGGANVLATAYYLGHVKPPVNVVCIVGAVENMPGAYATRPGDIVRAKNGKTIEILNTDAEGRLVLADLLSYAVEMYKPKFMVDIATLTGAVSMALGSMGAAILSNHSERSEWVQKISDKLGEPLWPLPIWPEMEGVIESKFADLKNIASSDVKAGTIVGALFLREFTNNTPWVHLDIAGMARNCQAVGYPPSGSSGYGLRLLCEICLKYLS